MGAPFLARLLREKWGFLVAPFPLPLNLRHPVKPLQARWLSHSAQICMHRNVHNNVPAGTYVIFTRSTLSQSYRRRLMNSGLFYLFFGKYFFSIDATTT